jgi:hypothetical protein
MKRKVLLTVVCLLSCFVQADEFPYVNQIVSNDSTVWLLISTNHSNGHLTYRIDFDNLERIYWREETDSVLCSNIKKQYAESWKYPNLLKKRTTAYDKSGNLWEIRGTSLGFSNNDNGWKELYHCESCIECVLHIRDNGEIWIGGYSFIGYFYKKEFQRIFFIDEYEMQGTYIYVCEEGESCPEDEPQPDPNDYKTEEEYAVAMSEWEAIDSGDGYPQSLCYCDGRKIGYIKKNNNGFVYFRTAPNISAPIIGIILDKVRVFYWERENNIGWYQVEINNVTGYVHKSHIERKK